VLREMAQEQQEAAGSNAPPAAAEARP
jgi:hypothetical protein